MSPVFAQSPSAAGQSDIRQQIESLRADQARIAELQQRTDESIRALEAKLQMTSPPATPALSSAAVASTTDSPPAAAPERLKVSGDIRFRGQGDSATQSLPNRYGNSIRARLGATYAVSDRVIVGGRLVTGNPDDPNSTDVQLSNFDDNFEVSLDQAYVQLNFDDLQIYGGKIPQPFTRTDLVWDGDVAPQGASATYKRALTNGGAFRANGLMFVIDKQPGARDSTMLGAQFGYDSPTLGGAWKYDISGAYYKYNMGSMASADSGDWRSNLLKPDGNYLSEFKLIDVIAGVTYTGFADRWPVRLVGDYVKNLGAATRADTGYGMDLAVGRSSSVGDWRFGYGYAVAQTDSVMAAFSHDNIGIATNYRLHTLSADYVVAPKTIIQALWYHYKPFHAADAGANDPRRWQDRVRLALLVNF